MTTIQTIKALRRENLSFLADAWGGPAKLAERLGIAPTYLYQLTNAEGKAARGLGDAKAREFEALANLPLGWLDLPHRGGEPMAEVKMLERRFDDLADNIATRETDPHYVNFPLLEGFAGMGKGEYMEDYPEVVESLRVSREWVERKLPGVPPDAIRVITGRGDSMRGQFNDGDLIFIDTRVKRFDQDSAYCFRWEGRVLVKRLQFVGRGLLRILSKNPDYPSIDAPLDNIEIGGRALAAWTLKEF